MNLAWSRKKLSPLGYRPPAAVGANAHRRNGFECLHEPRGARELLTPLVRRSYRVDGTPRSKIVFRPAIGIRTCCLADAADPMPRIAFWSSFDHRLSEAPLYVRHMSNWMRDEIGKRVPVMTAEDRLLAALYIVDGDTVDWHLCSEERRRKHLARARSRVADYLRTREAGDTPEAWTARKKAPPKPPPDYSHVNFGAGWKSPMSSDCRILGLTWLFTAEEAKKAYRAAVLVRHPDKGGSHSQFIELQGAWERIAAVTGAGSHPDPRR